MTQSSTLFKMLPTHKTTIMNLGSGRTMAERKPDCQNHGGKTFKRCDFVPGWTRERFYSADYNE